MLASDAALADYFERAGRTQTGQRGPPWPTIFSMIFSPPQRGEDPLPSAPAEFFSELADLASTGQINSRQARDVFAQMMATGKAPTALVQELGLAQISDVSQLEAFCDQAIAANPKSVARL